MTDISKESECVDDDAKTIVAEFDYQRKNYFIRWFEKLCCICYYESVNSLFTGITERIDVLLILLSQY